MIASHSSGTSIRQDLALRANRFVAFCTGRPVECFDLSHRDHVRPVSPRQAQSVGQRPTSSRTSTEIDANETSAMPMIGVCRSESPEHHACQ
jgi:hypothetical protein